MKQIFFIITFSLLLKTYTRADEGMWIPLYLQSLNETEMKSMGMRISAEDIYSINKSSLKDAILLFGRGCTAELVSGEGLILTNHHCGYGNIQSHSSIENDYLTTGFWAKNKNEELPNKGLTVTLLIRIEDVTQKILNGVKNNMTEQERNEIIESNIKKTSKEATKGTHYTATIKPFYYGNQYFMFVNETFKDVRLVGAPPSNIGKFGGDTDNWMWPRHTGDFSLFRVYTAPDGSPAEYSKENIPYKPKKFLEISLKGYKKGDFTFVFGYPGSTEQFTTSHGVELKTKFQNPIAIQMRQNRIEIIKKYSDNNSQIRINYAAKVAGIANGWKKWIGENKGIKRLNTINNKQVLENKFQIWANENNVRKEKYGTLINSFNQIYNDMKPYQLSATYFFEAAYSLDIFKFALSFKNLIVRSKTSQTEIDKDMISKLITNSDSWFKSNDIIINKETAIKLLSSYYKNHSREWQPEILLSIGDKYKGDFNLAMNQIFKNSIFTDKERLIKFLTEYKSKNYTIIENDIIYQLATGTQNYYIEKIKEQYSSFDYKLDSLYRIYVSALFEIMPNKRFYPDANLTLRVAYGNIDDYEPFDGVKYNYYSTLEGIIEKENPDIYDYVVEEKLKNLWKNKDYGIYADQNGKLPIAFIATNHTTGGNSGSPVLNADGQLIGINFDRNWEGTMSDLNYHPDYCRNISLDIRYCLFIIDKYAQAKWLINEMKIVS